MPTALSTGREWLSELWRQISPPWASLFRETVVPRDPCGYWVPDRGPWEF